jgi:transposase-like protein
MTKHSPFRYFKASPEIIRLAVMMYVRFPLSLRNVEDLLHERGIDISHETVRFGGTDLARCLRLKSVGDGWTECVRGHIGNGT